MIRIGSLILIENLGTDFRELDHRLGAAVDAEFLKHGGDMRLDGRFGDAELIGDLLVEQAFGQHAQHPALLRRQGLKAGDQTGYLG
jgi:hypothetical protein